MLNTLTACGCVVSCDQVWYTVCTQSVHSVYTVCVCMLLFLVLSLLYLCTSGREVHGVRFKPVSALRRRGFESHLVHFFCARRNDRYSLLFFYKGCSSVLERVYTVYSKVSKVILFLFLFCFLFRMLEKKENGF